MNKEMDLMQRLAVSKKIMDKHGEIKRGDGRPMNPIVEDFEPTNAKYNLPEEFLSESQTQTIKNDFDPTKPLERERILNSKLPDEIKQLMYEHPIVQPNTMAGTVLSDDVIEGAQRLMNKNKISDSPQTTTKQTKNVNENYTTSNINVSEIKNMIRDVVRDTVRDVVREELKEAGMIVESTVNTNETIQFKVGNTVFVGKVTKVKKLEK
jgi:hypothetical protein